MKRPLLLPLLAAIVMSVQTRETSAASLLIAPLDRQTPVDFEREVMPFLRDNCLSCHCKTTSKGGLNLETTELMMKGGDTGPAVKAGRGAESLMLQAAAHQDDDLKMPPRDNKAKAKNLTPAQLALLKLWIDQGAQPSPKVERVVQWQPLPEIVNAILAVAVTPDGQFAACARANRLFIYHLPSGRLVAEEAAHRDQINALAASPDGTLFASGGYREVKLWRRAKETQKFSIADAGSVLAISADGKWLATGKEDGLVALWSLPGRKSAKTFAVAKSAIRALAFAPDSAKLACASADKSLALWSIADGKQHAVAQTPAETGAIAWLGDKIAAGGADGVIRIWDSALANSTELAGHSGPVRALASQENQLLSGGADGSVRVWDIEKGKTTIQMNHGGPVASVAIRADGKRLASAGDNNLAKLWDAAGKPVAEMRGDRFAQEFALARERRLQIATSTVAFFKDAQQTAEKQIKAAQERVKKAAEAIPPKKQEAEAKQKAVAVAKEPKAAADQALASADAELKKTAETAAAAEKAAAQAKTAVEELKAKTPPDQPAIEKAAAEFASKSKDFDTAKSERDQGAAAQKQAAEKAAQTAKALADAEEAATKAANALRAAEEEERLANEDEKKTATALAEAKTAVDASENARKKADDELQAARKAAMEAEKPIRAVAFSSDGQIVATAGEDQAIHTWSGETGLAIDVIRDNKSPVAALIFAPGGELISLTQDHSAVAWDIAPAWKLEKIIGSADGKSPLIDRVESLAISPDGQFLAIGGGEPSRGGEVKLWDLRSGQFARDFANIHSDAVLSLEFSADGKFLASGAADKMARVIDLASGKIAKSFEGHTHHILGISWSLDGRTLATAGADGVVKTWNFTTGDRRKNIEGYDKEVTSVHFMGAGEQLVTSSGDNKVRIVNADGKEIRALPEVADFAQSAGTTADGKLVVAGGQDSVLRVWNAVDGKALASFPPGKK